MRYSRLFPRTLRAVPRDVQSDGYRLLLQGGYVRPVAQGLFTVTTLGMRVQRRIEALIRSELEALGGLEVHAPMVVPEEMWRRTGRDRLIGRDMVRFSDRAGRALTLAPTHEELMVEYVREGVQSVHELPIFLFQFQSKFRDERRTRCGLVRAREFLMNDAYSFHRSFVDLNNFFPGVFEAYRRIFERCRIDVVAAEAGVGYMGGERSYEFLMPCPCGDDDLVTCDRCGYAANGDVAVARRPSVNEPLRDAERIERPGFANLNAMRAALDVPRDRMVKAMAYTTGDRIVLAAIRGDNIVSEEKLSSAVGSPILGKATTADLEAAGLHAPWLSPIDAPHGAATVVVDETIAEGVNLLAGTNTRGAAWLNVSFGRDWEADHVADIVRIPDGMPCAHCDGGTLRRRRAVEVGNIFRLGDFYSRAMDFSVQDERENAVYPQMGSYGIGIGRLMSSIVQANHDERGILWPEGLAPFPVYLMSIGQSLEVRTLVERLAVDLGDNALFDDRHLSIGQKQRDAALLGIPVRVTVSPDSVASQEVELCDRSSGACHTVAVTDLIEMYAGV